MPRIAKHTFSYEGVQFVFILRLFLYIYTVNHTEKNLSNICLRRDLVTKLLALPVYRRQARSSFLAPFKFYASDAGHLLSKPIHRIEKVPTNAVGTFSIKTFENTSSV